MARESPYTARPSGLSHCPATPNTTPLVAVEAGRGESLRALVGAEGLVRGISGFGRSAPFGDLAAHFGFTPDQLAAEVLSHVRGAEG